ncbi:MAG: phosphomannomutase, partial [Desulfovibrionaceae bacterium]
MQIISHIFRAYDIRGLVGKDFDNPWVERLGQACGTYFLQRQQRVAIVGYDCRPSSPDFHTALVTGLLRTGVDVISIGMVPTPALYFAIKYLNKNAGIMITASHNPPMYNGFKIWSGATTLYGDALQDIKKIHDSENFVQGAGVASCHDILPAYREAITSRTRLSRPIKVVVDGGNGSGGPTLVQTLTTLGAEVLPLYCEPDGTFPHHHPDPIVEANMRDLMAKVQQEGAELGIGLDGDADRLGIVDKHGRLLNGDELLAIFAHDLLDRQPQALIL